MTNAITTNHNGIIFSSPQLSDTPRIMQIITQAKEQMRREGKTQWIGPYPAESDIINDINQSNARVLITDNKIIAYGAVIYNGELAYDDIKGSWSSGMPYVVLHRLAVADEVKRQGIAALFFNHVCIEALSRDIHSFRVDTNYDNLYMQRLLKRLNFSYCGKVQYTTGERMAYELLM